MQNQIEKLSELEAWHAIGPESVVQRFGTAIEGLSDYEAKDRLDKHGPNTIPKVKGDGPLKLLWNQINNPLIWVLIGSAALAILVDPKDGLKNGIVIMAVVVLNSIVGFLQEFRAGKAIEALSGMVPEFASVVRSGRLLSVPVQQLVPGDIVQLASGDRVPADMRLIELKGLQVEEAALTGESVPSLKAVQPVLEDAPLGDRTSMVYGGSLVTYGVGKAVVVATGPKTELGRISEMMDSAVQLTTPLTKALASIGKTITIGIVLVSVLMLVVGVARAMIQTGVDFVTALRETVIFAIALAVGAIPEGLPAIVTIALAIGVQRMAKRNAIIRKLPAVETLGSTTVICSDKTGTLTRNEMTAVALWTPNGSYQFEGTGYDPEGAILRDGSPIDAKPEEVSRALRAAALCNDSTLEHEDGHWKIVGDPTEGALVVAAQKAGIDVATLRREMKRVDSVPFESEHQYMATLNISPLGDAVANLKGAPEALASRCQKDADGNTLDHAKVKEAVAQMASQGLRVLLIAEKELASDHLSEADLESGLTFLAVVGMVDPPRKEAIESIKACHVAGITVKMITGDHKATAQAIGEQLHITSGQPAVSGTQLAKMDDEELKATVASTNVFARVAPDQKLRLVRAIQAQDNVVAMTGDGVNDAPALKQSDIGVAMGITGTSVSKEAADIVLADDNFASIAAAVEEGRRVYDNLVKSLAFVLPTNLGLALILVAAVAFFPFDATTRELLLPMLPAQILWINLVGSVALGLPLAFEAKEPNLMQRPPRASDAPVLSPFVLWRTALTAIMMTLAGVGLFQWELVTALSRGLPRDVAIAEAQTMAVTTVVFFQIFYVLNCRSLHDSLLKIGLFTNKVVYIGMGAVILLQIGFVHLPFMNAIFGSAPLDWKSWLVAMASGMVILPLIAIEKALRARLRHGKTTSA